MTAKDLLGEHVIVRNPTIDTARWEGRVIAFSDSPSLVIETVEGRRMVLPAQWARLAPASPDAEEANRG